MRYLITVLFLTINLCSWAQCACDSLEIKQLVKIGELYSFGGREGRSLKEKKSIYVSKLNDYHEKKFKRIIDLIKYGIEGEKSIPVDSFFLRPSDCELKYWYVIREIHYNNQEKEPLDNSEVALKTLKADIFEPWLLDNYYYRLRTEIDISNNKKFQYLNFDLDKLKLKNVAEKAIFFFNITDNLMTGFSVVSMTGKTKEIMERVKYFPKFDSKYFYEYSDFDYVDFDWIGYKKIESYNETHFDKYYGGLLAYYSILKKEFGDEHADKVYYSSILSKPAYFKYVSFKDELYALYKNKTKK